MTRILSSYQFVFLWTRSLIHCTTKHYLYFGPHYHAPGHLTCPFLILVHLVMQWIPIDLVYSSSMTLILHRTKIQNLLMNSQHNLEEMEKLFIQWNLENYNSFWYLLTVPSQKPPTWNMKIRSDHKP